MYIPSAKSDAARSHVHCVEYSVKLRHGPVIRPIPIQVAIQTGTRMRKGERAPCRQRSTRGCTISQKSGMVEYTTQASQPSVWRNVPMLKLYLQAHSRSASA